MKNFYLCLMLTILLSGCGNPVEKAKTEISESVSTFLYADISLMNSTIDFMVYSNPRNYWFQTGDRSETPEVARTLEELVETVESFEYSDYYMSQAKTVLVEAASESYKKIADNYNNSGNSDYWAYQFFGDFGLMANRGVSAMPSKLKNAITQMDSTIRVHYFRTLPENIFQLEINTVGNNEMSIEQYKEIRTHILQVVPDSISHYVECENEEWKSKLITNIMEEYARLYPVNDVYKYLTNNRKYAGALFRYASAPSENYCGYDELGNDWGYIFISYDDIVIKCSEYVGAETIDYQIGKLNDSFCEFKQMFTHPTGINDAVPPSIEEQIKRGEMKKIKKERIELLPTECSQYLFKFKSSYELPNGNTEIVPYLVKMASLEEYNRFIADIKRIDEINNMFK